MSSDDKTTRVRIKFIYIIQLQASPSFECGTRCYDTHVHDDVVFTFRENTDTIIIITIIIIFICYYCCCCTHDHEPSRVCDSRTYCVHRAEWFCNSRVATLFFIGFCTYDNECIIRILFFFAVRCYIIITLVHENSVREAMI